MSTPNLGPSEDVQLAANLLARERQRGISFATTESSYEDVFAILTDRERREARAFARDATTFQQAVLNSDLNDRFASIPAEERPGGDTGLFDVTVRFGQKSADSRWEDYRTVLIAYDPAQTKASLIQTALEEVYGQSDPPDLEVSDEFEIRFISFNLHE